MEFKEFIEESIKEQIKTRIEEEIEKEVEKFRQILTHRKDQYIGAIMQGISIMHEHYENRIHYRITFENIDRIDRLEEYR